MELLNVIERRTIVACGIALLLISLVQSWVWLSAERATQLGPITNLGNLSWMTLLVLLASVGAGLRGFLVTGAALLMHAPLVACHLGDPSPGPLRFFSVLSGFVVGAIGLLWLLSLRPDLPRSRPKATYAGVRLPGERAR